MRGRVESDFFKADALEIAPKLLGMQLVRQFDNQVQLVLDINEIEVYRGEEDLSCHASKGRTQRTEVMYHEGGRVYVYLIYGMYWLLNITTGPINHPQAILIRGTQQFSGPGRIGKALQLDKTFYGEDICKSDRLWILSGTNAQHNFETRPRVGIDYAGEYWANVPWRYVLKPT